MNPEIRDLSTVIIIDNKLIYKVLHCRGLSKDSFIGANKISKDFELRDFILISPVVARHCNSIYNN